MTVWAATSTGGAGAARAVSLMLRAAACVSALFILKALSDIVEPLRLHDLSVEGALEGLLAVAMFGAAAVACWRASDLAQDGEPAAAALRAGLATAGALTAGLLIAAAWKTVAGAFSLYDDFTSKQALAFGSLGLLAGLIGAGIAAALQGVSDREAPPIGVLGVRGAALGSDLGAGLTLASIPFLRFEHALAAIVVLLILSALATRLHLQDLAATRSRPADLLVALAAVFLAAVAAAVGCATAEATFDPGGNAGWNVLAVLVVFPVGSILTGGLLYGAWRLSQRL